MSAIRQEVHFSATPARVFHALMDSEAHSAFTGAPAEISPEEGGAWSAYGGGITGRNVEIVADTRIVQAWRAASWPAGVYSVVCFELSEDEGGTQVILTHTGYPEGEGVHLEEGWKARYWQPLTAFLGA